MSDDLKGWSYQPATMALEQQLEGSVYHKVVGEVLITVVPMTFGKGRINYSELGSCVVENCWCYDNLNTAVVAATFWEPDKDQDPPLGWFRNPIDGRRRPDGDPSKE